MYYINKDSDCYLVCSNSEIIKESDFRNAIFDIYNLDGNKIEKNINDFVNLLKLEQNNYTDQNSLEYVLFK